MMVMTNRPELRPPLLLLIMSGLVISNNLTSTEISQSQSMTTSRSVQEHSTAVQPISDPGGLIAAHTDENTTSVTINSNAGTEKISTNALAAGTGNVTGSESPLPTGPPVRNSTSASSTGHSTLMPVTSVGPKEGTHKEATNSSTATVSVAPTVHGPPTNTTRPPSSHVTEKTASTAAKPASTNPPSSQSSQTPGKTTTTSTTTTTTSGGNRGHICPTKEAHKKEPIVGLCLIAIAVLAGLAIIFIFSTIILATKLASSRYRNRMHLLQDTEMVCISALMNDTEHPIPKPRHPKSNGALIPNMEDEDGDALTLNSFLPDTECPALN
ncbi:P-selectin glycoprotein ligand 1 [Astyanax mexicanus]|uniref:P-selectin glycoprotein ligand 1 n=1 Tax=Astyanax mexicanus TaxID=7994 RepID=A0A8T2KS20_ASTMX|nr:P-selectin glycoprotein ligand 1 [Astyanax mexicanus]XP_015458187.3 P-selectin glycoprotein ligand 1 [Astyanax mexicanus]KAG9261419.1 P-selectin glycoprotein ligand 1 [Astyanax mexicanus]